jgi:hypothetical protein
MDKISELPSKYSGTVFLCLCYDNDESSGVKMVHLSRQIDTLRQRVEDENLERCSIIWRNI